MKLKLDNHKTDQIPEELKSPTYYLDDLGNPFICDFSEKINNWSASSKGHSGEFKIKTINLFIGANNSGKSRLLRGLLKLNIESIYTFNTLYYKTSLDELEEEYSNKETNSLLSKYNLHYGYIKNQLEKYYKNEINEINEIDNALKKISNNENDSRIIYYTERINQIIKEIHFSKTNKISKNNYTPILRSLYKSRSLENSTFKKVALDLFFDTTENDYKSISIHTGLELWQSIHNHITTPKKKELDNFCQFLSVNFFNDKKIDLIPNTEEGTEKLISINIDNKGFKDINEIGDGIQTLIILLFPIFMAQKNEVFYIEEPEMNLHPAYQRIFIETLLYNKDLQAKNLKYFFTTHSNHFLDLTLMNDDVSFFQFQKIEEGKHLIKSKIKPDKEILESLGVNTSSVLLANTSIWVEGPTDRKYISKFLKLYCEAKNKPVLKEDIDFAFFEYGGNLIAHYLFDDEQVFDDNIIRNKINAFSSANKIYLLADNDNVEIGSQKHNRQEILESISTEKKYFQYQNTIVKEIENVLPVKIISDFTSELLTDDVSKQKAKEIAFDKKDYDSIGLGEFYENIFSTYKIDTKHWKKFKVTSTSGNSNTLTTDYKNKLANFVIDSDYTYNDLIKDNKNLETIIENLYNFIHNDTNSIQK